MLKDCASLICRDAGKPLDEVMQRRIIFQVFEQCRDRHARAAEDPGPAHACRVSLYSWAGGPIDHGGMVALGVLALPNV